MTTTAYVMIGGFLGAGKTTAIVEFSRYLATRSLSSAIITNDQSVNLVDSARATAAGCRVEEITGGCFFCRFDSLVNVSHALSRERPLDVLIAEPVGSCTDLQATVAYPLRSLHAAEYRVTPYSVIVDPLRLAQLLSTAPDFSAKVNYIYRKQLEEADFLVLNKIDTIDNSTRATLVQALKTLNPAAQIFEVSCLTGQKLDSWFSAILSHRPGNRPAIDIDYDEYADGEALLGWLNATVTLNALAESDADAILLSLAQKLQSSLMQTRSQIAHLKMSLTTDSAADIASLSVTRTQVSPNITNRLHSRLSSGKLNINLRAEAAPEILRATVTDGLGVLSGVTTSIDSLSAFRPGRPVPTHRMRTVTN